MRRLTASISASLRPVVALFAAVLVICAGALQAKNGEEQDLAALMELLHFTQVTEVLVEEGRGLADDFAEQGLGVPQFAWEEMLGKLYHPKTMLMAMEMELGKALDGVDLAPMTAFFSGELGQKIARLELEARRALTEEAAQDAANAAWAALDPDTARAQLIEDYVNVNDLIDLNVVGALNSDLAYYEGLWQSVDTQTTATSEDLMREIWASEPDVRADVSEWVYSFSVVAYDTLSDEELSAYIDFARSDAGQTLNTALFAAFDAVYDDISRGLGGGTGVLMKTYAGEDL